MIKIVLVAALLGITAGAVTKCITGDDAASAKSAACNNQETKCFGPKWTDGTGYTTDGPKVGYGCGTCAARKDVLSKKQPTAVTIALTDCDDSCTTDDCNAVVVQPDYKCHTYNWVTDTFVAQTAKVCPYKASTFGGCIAPKTMKTQNSFDDKGGCDPKTTGCGKGTIKCAAAACTKDSCNAFTTNKCFSYTWDATAKTYKQSKTAAACSSLLVGDFKCSKPADMTKEADYVTGSGCGACPANKKCAPDCTKDSCNSAGALFTFVPALLALLYALL
jgi:hypothetical protein